MTSSLVGSEMCIRDSYKAGVTNRGSGHIGVFCKKTASGQDQHAHRFHPVSYTHLTLPTICSV
eukprot:594470-Prorocentrum_lima.AAC.1